MLGIIVISGAAKTFSQSPTKAIGYLAFSFNFVPRETTEASQEGDLSLDSAPNVRSAKIIVATNSNVSKEDTEKKDMMVDEKARNGKEVVIFLDLNPDITHQSRHDKKTFEPSLMFFKWETQNADFYSFSGSFTPSQ